MANFKEEREIIRIIISGLNDPSVATAFVYPARTIAELKKHVDGLRKLKSSVTLEKKNQSGLG